MTYAAIDTKSTIRNPHPSSCSKYVEQIFLAITVALLMLLQVHYLSSVVLLHSQLINHAATSESRVFAGTSVIQTTVSLSIIPRAIFDPLVTSPYSTLGSISLIRSILLARSPKITFPCIIVGSGRSAAKEGDLSHFFSAATLETSTIILYLITRFTGHSQFSSVSLLKKTLHLLLL